MITKNRIAITVEAITLEAELNDSKTARQILGILPLEGKANVWGEEIYFDIPLEADSEPNARAEVEVGELGYWPMGEAFCIFFGPTPSSRDEKPRAYSPVNVFGRVVGDAKQLKSITQGAIVQVKLID
jgi:hypothetical protein